MKITRIKRYKDKINVILERSEEINEWTEGYDVDEFTRDEKTKLAAYKAFQEVAESCMDIIAMACKDEKIVPKDDYTNIENLKFIDERMKEVLTEVNGLRNRLVHRYNQSDDLVAFVSVKELLPKIEEFVEVVEQWMRKTLREK
jgi:uncharacterized protein YutE (UPF0331/DUF86 family)